MTNALNQPLPQLRANAGEGAGRSPKFRLFWLLISCVVILYLPLLIVMLVARGIFPWDLLNWPESPFLIGMLKMHNHQPIYTEPMDMNSFVYSPGLSYVTYALLNPFRLAFDIRFCRFVNDLIGMLAAGAGMLTTRGLVRSTLHRLPGKSVWFICWGLFWLVISTNFLSDAPHPDNIQALHALTVFWLCFTSLDRKQFSRALATMAVAGIGVFTKQTGAACVFGVALLFAVFNPWGWRRWLLLALTGGIMLGISLYLLWLPPSGRFFTLDVLSQQKVETHRIPALLTWLCARRRGVLLFLTMISGFAFWKAGGSRRRYLVCWACLGLCSVAPNSLAYLKIQGLQNNLCLFEVWMFSLALPMVLMLPEYWERLITLASTRIRLPGKARVFPAMFQVLMALYVLALVPHKEIPIPEEYAFCRKVEAAVHQDVLSGRKVLVSHGCTFLINAGITQPPLDQTITALEYHNGNKPELFSGLKERIAASHYDKIYLAGSYGSDVQDLLDQRYAVQSTFQQTLVHPRRYLGRGGFMTMSYIVLAPR